MGITIDVKVIEVSGSLRITIPAPVAKQLRIKRGDTLVVDLKDDTIMVKKKEKSS